MMRPSVQEGESTAGSPAKPDADSVQDSCAPIGDLFDESAVLPSDALVFTATEADYEAPSAEEGGEHTQQESSAAAPAKPLRSPGEGR